MSVTCVHPIGSDFQPISGILAGTGPSRLKPVNILRGFAAQLASYPPVVIPFLRHG